MTNKIVVIDGVGNLRSVAQALRAVAPDADVQISNDPAVIDAVGDIERLTTNLSQKIWQKITLVETDLEDDRGARAVSAGELSQLEVKSGS